MNVAEFIVTLVGFAIVGINHFPRTCQNSQLCDLFSTFNIFTFAPQQILILFSFCNYFIIMMTLSKYVPCT